MRDSSLTMVNEYTAAWFRAFAETVDPTATRGEIEAFTGWLPVSEFPRVLDLCCRLGRHSGVLSELGYDVVGVDRDPGAIAVAKLNAPAAAFVVADQRNLDDVGEPFDAVLLLWQSFGYFDSDTNNSVLAGIASVLRPGGRLLLDIYHPGYWLDHQGVRTRPRDGVESITDTVTGSRLSSRITYSDGTVEEMNFELIDPNELASRAEAVGLTAVDQCTWWDPLRPPTSEQVRYQTVFERT